MTGIINDTKFTIQSLENEYFVSNSYSFYYYIKGITLNPIYINGGGYGNREVNVVFEYLKIPENISIITIEIYCEVTPQLGNTYILFRELHIYKNLEFKDQFSYKKITKRIIPFNGLISKCCRKVIL